MIRTNTLQIRTAEGVVFSQLLAGPVSRFVAWLVDFAVLMSVMTLVSMILGFLSLIAGDVIVAFAMVLFFVMNLGYGIYFEWRWRGQTLGKRVMRLRVVDAEGLRLRFYQIVIRNLLRMVDMLPIFYLVGGLALILSRRAQRLGDFAANTVVIRIPRLSTPNLDFLAAGKYNSFRDHPQLEARLRQRVSAAEAALALQALARRDGLEPVPRVELFARLADHFREKIEFPEETAGAIADEQYVRNVLDSVYRKPKGRIASAPEATTSRDAGANQGAKADLGADVNAGVGLDGAAEGGAGVDASASLAGPADPEAPGQTAVKSMP
jgi:uncharacterized RDD family membrane protein YckC